MTLSTLNDDEREVVKCALEATFMFFDLDFHTRLGVTSDEMRKFLLLWPNIDDKRDESSVTLAINNSLNEMSSGIGGDSLNDDKAVELIGVNRNEIRRIYTKWARNRGWTSTGIV